MQPSELIELSVEQTINAIGDPIDPIFGHMYQKFPELAEFKDINPDWENYMFEEIMGHFLGYYDNVDMSLAIVREMSVHHEMIGVSNDIFREMYNALYTVCSPHFKGENSKAMNSAWQEAIQQIQANII